MISLTNSELDGLNGGPITAEEASEKIGIMTCDRNPARCDGGDAL